MALELEFRWEREKEKQVFVRIDLVDQLAELLDAQDLAGDVADCRQNRPREVGADHAASAGQADVGDDLDELLDGLSDELDADGAPEGEMR